MDPRSTEGSCEAFVLLQVGQSVVVKLHRLAGEPSPKLVDALLHPGREVLFKTTRLFELEVCGQILKTSTLTCSKTCVVCACKRPSSWQRLTIKSLENVELREKNGIKFYNYGCIRLRYVTDDVYEKAYSLIFFLTEI